MIPIVGETVRRGLSACFTPYSAQRAYGAIDSVRTLYLEQVRVVCRSVGYTFPQAAVREVEDILAAMRGARPGTG